MVKYIYENIGAIFRRQGQSSLPYQGRNDYGKDKVTAVFCDTGWENV